MTAMPEESDRSLDEVIADYIVAEELGETVSRDEYLKLHPQFAEQLQEFFGDRDRFRHLTTSASSNEQSTDALSTVQYFGDYELLEEIGRGGMGVIYKARQVSLNRIVALKMVLEGRFTSERDVQRFRAEAEAAASLDHPNIVPLYEVGEHEGRQYFSMKMIEGDNLATRLKNHKSSVREVAYMMAKIAQAVHFAHQHGILHRDLKPANILLDKKGSPHVVDFGLAKRIEGQNELTQTGAVLGTPSYMAPEQAAGETKSITTTTDVYGLGAIFYAVLTGQAPFQGESSADTIQRVIREDPVRPSLRNEDVDRDLETVCLKCLEKDPKVRYTSAQDLADDLECWIAGKPIIARPIGRADRVWRWCKRNPVVSGLSMSLAILFLIISISSPIVATRLAGLVEDKESLLGEKETLIDRLNSSLSRQKNATRNALEQSRLASLGTYNVQLARVRESLPNDPKRAIELLEDESACPLEFRDFPWGHFYWKAKPNDLCLGSQDQPFTCVEFSPDGKTIATGCVDGLVRLWDVATGKQIGKLGGQHGNRRVVNGEVVSHNGTPMAIAFSPNGKLIAIGGTSRHIEIFDAEKKELVKRLAAQTFDSKNIGFLDLEFTPDSKTLVSSDGDAWGQIKLWDIDTFELLEKVKTGASTWGATQIRFDLSPDGTKVAFYGHNNRSFGIRMIDLTAENKSNLIRPAGAKLRVTSLAYSQHGNLFAAASSSGVRIWDMQADWQTRWWAVSFKRVGTIRTLEFSPDGKLVAVINGNRISICDVQSGLEIKTLSVNQSWFQDFAFSPDGQVLASVSKDGTLRLWNVSQGELSGLRPGHIRAHHGSVSVLEVSKDGERILTSCETGIIKLWDNRTGQTSLEIRSAIPFAGVSLAADGQQIAFSRSNYEITSYDVESCKETSRLSGFEFPARKLAHASDGKRLASIHLNRELIVWNLETKSAIWRNPSSVSALDFLQFSADGSLLATPGLENSIKIWDATSGNEIATLKGHSNKVTDVSFDPDGNFLASGSFDGSIRIWDLHDYRHNATIQHSHTITSIEFSSDGRTIASADGYGDIKMWHAETFQEQATIKGDASTIHGLVFTPDNSTLIASASDGSLRFFNSMPSPRLYRNIPLAESNPRIISIPKERRHIGRAVAMDRIPLPASWPQFGGTSHRNNTPIGSNIATDWDVGRFDRRTGKWIEDDSRNIKWGVALGSQSYGNPVVADGRVFVGTNNGAGYLSRYPFNVDLGCLLCFRESDGEFLWQDSMMPIDAARNTGFFACVSWWPASPALNRNNSSMALLYSQSLTRFRMRS